MSSWTLVLVISLAILFGLVMIAAARRGPRHQGVDGHVSGGYGGWDAGHHDGGCHHGSGHDGSGDFGGGGGGGHH